MTLPRRLPALLGIAVALFAADRLSKIWVAKHIPFGASEPVIPHLFALSHWNNEGAAFSLFADSTHPQMVHAALIGFSLLAAAAVLVALWRLGSRFTPTSVGLAMVLAGAVGNAHDRIAYGSVVDFLEVHIFSYHWPDFNVADSAIVVGACLLMLDALRPQRTEA